MQRLLESGTSWNVLDSWYQSPLSTNIYQNDKSEKEKKKERKKGKKGKENEQCWMVKRQCSCWSHRTLFQEFLLVTHDTVPGVFDGHSWYCFRCFCWSCLTLSQVFLLLATVILLQVFLLVAHNIVNIVPGVGHLTPFQVFLLVTYGTALNVSVGHS